MHIQNGDPILIAMEDDLVRRVASELDEAEGAAMPSGGPRRLSE